MIQANDRESFPNVWTCLMPKVSVSVLFNQFRYIIQTCSSEMSGRRSAWNRVPRPKDFHTFTFAFTRIVKIPSNKCPHWAGSGGIVGCGTPMGASCNLGPFFSTPERPSGMPVGTPEAALPLPGPHFELPDCHAP